MKRVSKLLAAILCLALALSACGGPTAGSSQPSASSQAPAPGSSAAPSSDASSGTAGAVKTHDPDTLVYAVAAEPGKIDPQNNTIIPGIMIEKQMYETLVNKNFETGEIEPALATEWKWNDDTHLEMKLREGVKFHDGTPFTADDVKFTIGRFAAGAATSSLYAAFDADKTEIVDEHTIIIAFKSPYAPALNFLTNGRAYIVCKSWVESKGEEALNQNANGTGAFQFKEWVIGSHVSFERFEDYWGEKPTYKNLTVRFIVEDTARMVALETSEIDIASELQDADITNLKAGKVEGITGFVIPSFKVWYLAFNEDFEPFSHKEVRLAIAHAVDWAQAVESAGGSTVALAKSCLASTIFAYEPQGTYEYDVEKAKTLMKEAGYENGFDVTCIQEEIPTTIRILEIIQAYLKEININMEIQAVDTATWNENNTKGNSQMTIGNMTANTTDPAHTLNQVSKNSSNTTLNWHDEEFNRLYDAGLVEMDEAKRAEIYKELQKYVFEAALQVPMYEQIITYGIRDYVLNFVPDSGLQLDLKKFSIAS